MPRPAKRGMLAVVLVVAALVGLLLGLSRHLRRSDDRAERNEVVAACDRLITTRRYDPESARPLDAAEPVIEPWFLEAHEGYPLAGRVLDQEGRPIQGASVGVVAPSGVWALQATTTDAGGRYDIRRFPLDGGWVFAALGGFARGYTRVERDERASPDVILRPGFRIEGQVVDGEGNAIPGALVSATPIPPGYMPWLQHLSLWETCTDPEGRFVIPDVAAGSGTVDVWARHATEGIATTTLHAAAAGETRRVDLVARTCSVAGTVSYEDGAPAPGATVSARPSFRQLGHPSVRTDARGEYLLMGLPPGSADVRTAPPGIFPDPMFARLTTRTVAVDLAGCAVVGVDFRVPRMAGNLSGTVVDAHGSPVGGAHVSAFLEESPSHGRGPQVGTPATTDSLGAFTITGLLAGTYLLEASPAGGPPGQVEGVEVGSRSVLIALPPTVTIAGVVVDERGSPRPADALHLVQSRAETDGVPTGGPVLRPGTGAGVGVQTGLDGAHFRVTGLRPGKYLLAASAASGMVSTPLEVEASQSIDGLRLVVASGVTIEGRLSEFPEDGPLSGFAVFGLTPVGQLVRSDTGIGGSFTMEGLAPGPIDVIVQGHHHAQPGRTFERDWWHFDLRRGLHRTVLRLVAHDPVTHGRPTRPIDLQLRAGRVVVAAVSRDAAPRIRVGDAVRRLDGHSLAGLGTQGLHSLLRGPWGSTVVLDLARRDGSTYSAELKIQP